MEPDADVRAYDALSQHVRLTDVISLTRFFLEGASNPERFGGPSPAVALRASELGLSREDAATPFGNAFDVLERGPEDDAERALAHALAAHALAGEPRGGRDEEDRRAAQILWLAAHTPFDATGLIDHALGGAEATALWDAVGERIRRVDAGFAASLGRGEAVIAAVALASSPSTEAKKLALSLATEVRDEKLAFIFERRRRPPATAPLTGEIMAPPRGSFLRFVFAVTGISLLRYLAGLLARTLLAFRQPARVAISDDGGLRVQWHVEIFGRTLRECTVFVPSDGLARVTREVRYSGIALYAALLALALGSYVGMSAFVDGVRAGSPSLLAFGIIIAIVGLAFDFAVSSLLPGARGRCRVLITPRRGSPICVGPIDASSADAWLTALVRR